MRFAWLLVLGVWACAPAPGEVGSEAALAPAQPQLGQPQIAQPWLGEGWRRGATDSGVEVAWRAVGDELPRNRHFELDVWVLRDGVPVTQAELQVRATMPDHGHGMNVEPRALLRPDGSYRVRGMLLHMAGHWELSVHVIEPGRSHAARFELDVS